MGLPRGHLLYGFSVGIVYRPTTMQQALGAQNQNHTYKLQEIK
jgi:hypothetical protein